MGPPCYGGLWVLSQTAWIRSSQRRQSNVGLRLLFQRKACFPRSGGVLPRFCETWSKQGWPSLENGRHVRILPEPQVRDSRGWPEIPVNTHARTFPSWSKKVPGLRLYSSRSDSYKARSRTARPSHRVFGCQEETFPSGAWIFWFWWRWSQKIPTLGYSKRHDQVWCQTCSQSTWLAGPCF